MDTETYAHLAIEGRVAFHPGPSGLPHAVLTTGQARAEVALQGAQVLSYRPEAEGPDVLFVSRQAVFAPGKAVRGGIPICWPWFGPRAGLPQHGFVRLALWTATASGVSDTGAWLRMELRDDDSMIALWPHPFWLELTVTLGETLDVALTVHNTGPTTFNYTSALHSYFAVADSRQTFVTGLEGVQYYNKVNDVYERQEGVISFADAELLDRVYVDTTATCEIVDATQPLHTVVAKSGSRTTVVWNPGQEAIRSFADLADDEYTAFVCVETANAEGDVIALRPGTAYTTQASIRRMTASTK